jgi:peptide-methionine (R)-S-oxide reductase
VIRYAIPLIVGIFLIACQPVNNLQNKSEMNTKNPHEVIEINHPFRVQHTQEEWKQILDESAYQILRNKATERPFSSPLELLSDTGNYLCAGCGTELFKSNQKFDSGCGWPSFFDAANKQAIVTAVDNSHGMQRIEILCANCGGHLGHLFDDGPRENGGLRYCVNGKSLQFKPQ